MRQFTGTRRAFLSSLGVASVAGLLPSPLLASAAGEPASPDRGLAAANDFMFDEGLVYLQTGSLGPTPRPVMQKTLDAWQLLERNPVVHGYGDLEKELDVVRGKGARLLGCATDEIILTTSTTDGMCRVALGLNLAAGDRVLTTDQEHPGGSHCWEFLARSRGIVLDVVQILPGEHDASAIVDRMRKAITPRTKVMSFSHLLSSTGLRMPVAELTAVARTHGCVSVVDGAQAVGGTAVDVKTLGCDIYATSGHKWLLGPPGTGLLYVSASLGSRLELINLQDGHAAYSGVNGVSNIPGVIGLGASIDYVSTRRLSVIEEHNLALRTRLDAALASVRKLTVVSPREPALASPLLTYRFARRRELGRAQGPSLEQAPHHGQSRAEKLVQWAADLDTPLQHRRRCGCSGSCASQ
jgi:selenocysteine lyase/cysteine desulfurase